jgi:hypothetical protein
VPSSISLIPFNIIMPTEQHIKIKEEASPHAVPTAAANSLGAEI